MILPAHGVEFGLAIQLVAFFTHSVESGELGLVVDAQAANLGETSLLQVTAIGAQTHHRQ